jgi:hypothetical protein
MRNIFERLSVWSFLLVVCLAVSAQAGDWEALNESIKAAGGPGYSRAIQVAPATGNIFSTNKASVLLGEANGTKWRHIDNGKIAGNLWFGLSLRYYPENEGLVVFKKDPQDQPVTSGFTTDMGKTWTTMTRVTEGEDKLRSYGWSWGDVYWKSEPQRVLARQHHSKRIWLSTDAGQEWKELPHQTTYFGFANDGSILMLLDREKVMMRSTDDGKTFEPVLKDIDASAHMPVRRYGKVYWVVKDGVVVSKDDGKTWKKLAGNLNDAYWGPFFGESEDDMIVVTLESVMRSWDGGKTWKALAHNRAHELEKEAMKKKGEDKLKFSWFIGQTTWGWDVKNDLFYLGCGPIERINLSEATEEDE